MPTLDQVIKRIGEIFDDYLPPPPPPPQPGEPPSPPLPNLSFVSVTERSVGIGNRVGSELRGTFGVLALKGVRVEVVLRFQLWANSPTDVDDAVQTLIGDLLADRDELRKQGVLRLALKSVGTSDTPGGGDTWRQSIEFSLLYEEPFSDTDGAESLIAQIPIKINSEFDETTVVTDEMIRWDDKDDTSAPPLILRGPVQIGDLSSLYFQQGTGPGTAPGGSVTVRRTFDGPSGQANTPASFDDFLAAVCDPAAPDRNAEFVFNSLADFLAVFGPGGDPVILGDWKDDTALDDYQSLALKIDPPIKLPLATDRFEIVFQHKKFDQPAVLYLRAAHSTTT
ncbi:MAG TPA: hypothetical protein VN687_10240 [Blastocatellia bacterium]|nr:hypothetical protein [Blastocatellia bacterium]